VTVPSRVISVFGLFQDKLCGIPLGYDPAASFSLLSLILLAWTPVRADGFREWRDVVSGNSITAKLIDKRGAGDELEVQLLDKKTRRTYWINVRKRLLAVEEAYVKAWVKPEDRIKFLKFAYSPKHSKTMGWFAVDTGNEGIRVVVESTGRPSEEADFPAKTKKTAYLPEGAFARNKSGDSLATVRVYAIDSELLLFTMRNLK